MHYRYRETVYHITVRQPGGGGASRVTVDGVEQPGRGDRRSSTTGGSTRSRCCGSP